MKDHDCERIALADSFYSRGQTDAAARLYCTVRDVRKALGDSCVAVLGQVHVDHLPVQSTLQADVVTHAELMEVERRMLQHGVSK